MVSKASEDLPDPESPVTTVSVLRGMETERLRRLCCRAPRTVMCVIAMLTGLAAHSTVPRGGEMANPQDTASGGARSCPRSSGFVPGRSAEGRFAFVLQQTGRQPNLCAAYRVCIDGTTLPPRNAPSAS